MNKLQRILNRYRPSGGRRIAESGQVVNVADVARRLDNAIDPFSHVHTAEYSPIFEIKSSYGISALRDGIGTTGTGAVSWLGGKHIVSGAATGDTASLRTAKRGRYLAGLVGVAGVGVRLVTSPASSGDEARWGYFDSDRGFGFGIDTGGLFSFTRKGGTDKIKRYRADWVADKLDGTGPSGESFDPEDGATYRLPHIYYGYGTFSYQILLRGTGGDRDSLIEVDQQTFPGELSIPDPNLPVSVEVSGVCSVAVGGRQYGVYGRYDPERRIVSDWASSVSINATGWTPLLSFRPKATAPTGDDGYRSVAINVAGSGVISDSDAVWALFLDGTLTDAIFRTPRGHSASETATDYDVSATAISGGESIYKAIVAGGQGNASGGTESEAPDIDVPSQGIVTLAARTVSGTGTASAVLRDRQEW